MNKTLSLLAIVLATAATSFAGQTCSKKVVCAPEDCRFRANEWQVDTAVVGGAGTYGDHSFGAIGGGIGVNYFWSKYFGVGIDDSLGGLKETCHSSSTEFVNSFQADLIARYPICSWNLAPYAMVGGGGNWTQNVSQGNGNVGGGLEYRLTRNVGLFADCRWLYGSNAASRLSAALPRAGVRLAF
ncbi:MAG TPA: hypothetical protein VJK54_10970 [Chthoniobacterales bacterium]|nr:hypothetical protein [Chthoniobacterales bacterium]